MKSLLAISFLLAAYSTGAQIDTARLHSADLQTLLTADGSWGRNSASALSIRQGAGYFPLMQHMGVWITGRNSKGVRAGSVCDVFSDSSNFLPGPLELGGTAAANAASWNRVFVVSESEILKHKRSYKLPNYSVPASLADWPGNGPQGFDAVLAPYADVDRNGSYNPQQGDYPFVGGTACAYTIANDLNGAGWKQGRSMGVEVQQMARVFAKQGQELPAVLLRYTLHNRSLEDYSGVRFTMAADFCIGSSADDYLTTDVAHHALVAYNGSDSDALFGKTAPACAMMFLNKPAGATMYFESSSDAVKGKPLKLEDYFNLARGSWKTGKPLAFGNAGLDGNTTAHFIYSNGTDPQFPGKWNEWEAANFPGRRTGLISTDSFNLPAGTSVMIEVVVSALAAVGNNVNLAAARLEEQRQLASALLDVRPVESVDRSELYVQKGDIIEVLPSRNHGSVKLEFFRLNGSSLGSYCILSGSSFNLKKLPEEGLILMVATSEEYTSKALIIN